MNPIDPKTAQQVWQRVQGKPEPTQDVRELEKFLLLLQEDILCCQQLSRQLPERFRTRLKQMSSLEQTHAASLGGMYRLLTGKKPPLSKPHKESEPPEIALRRYYGRVLRRMNYYEKGIGDPQFGQVFSLLTQQTKELCQNLLVLLGSFS